MLRKLFTRIDARLVGVLAMLGLAGALYASTLGGARGQSYPTQNPTYIPAALQSSQTLSGTAPLTSTPYQVNNIGTVYCRVLGTNSGLVATFQITESRAASPTWSNIAAVEIGVAKVATITGNGLYRLMVAGSAQLRLNITALTSGTVILDCSGGYELNDVTVTPITRASYSATVKGLVVVTGATDFLVLTGNATTTTRVTHASCSATVATAAVTADLQALTRSTADSGGTSSAVSASPHDPNYPAALSSVLSYTANPSSLGTLVGSGLRSIKLGLPLAATGAVIQSASWDFGGVNRENEGSPTLRSATQQFALNGGGSTFANATSFDCNLSWTEE